MQLAITQVLQAPSADNLTRIFNRIDQEINDYNLEEQLLPSHTVQTSSYVKFLWAPKLWILLQVMRVRHDTQWAR